MASGSSAAERRRALIWVALGASLWGTDTVFRRPLTGALSSAQIVLFEHLILSAVLLPAFLRARAEWRSLRAREWVAVIGVAWGGSAAGTILFTEAVRIGNPTTAVLLQKTQPVFAALLAGVLLRERLGSRFWALLAVALCAAYLVSFGANPPAWTGMRTEAALLALGAAAFWGSSTVLGRYVLSRVSFLTITALRVIVATPLLIATAAARPVAASAPLDFGQAALLVLLAFVPGLVALLVYYRGLRHCRASRAAIAELSFPATAALLNWAFLGARISPTQLAGFALLWGVILNLERSRLEMREEVQYAESGN